RRRGRARSGVDRRPQPGRRVVDGQPGAGRDPAVSPPFRALRAGRDRRARRGGPGAGRTGPAPPGPTPAIAFLDLSGYTKLTEEHGDRAAAELAARLVEIVHELAHRHGGRPGKTLGGGD